MAPCSTLDGVASWRGSGREVHVLRQASSIPPLVEMYIVDPSRSNCCSEHLLCPGCNRIESRQVSARVVCRFAVSLASPFASCRNRMQLGCAMGGAVRRDYRGSIHILAPVGDALDRYS